MKTLFDNSTNLLDLWNETGGTLRIDFAGYKIVPTKTLLENMQAADIAPTIDNVIYVSFTAKFGEAAERTLESACQLCAGPTLTLDGQNGGSLNVTMGGQLEKLICKLAGHEE